MKCSIDGCGRTAQARTWCKTHWARWKRTGDPLTARTYVSGSIRERFEEYATGSNRDGMATTTPKLGWCRIWAGAKNKHGYGIIRVGGRTWLAHRIAFAIKFGRAPTLDVLHKCDTPSCVRWEHLYEGDAKQNSSDALERGRLRPLRGESNPFAKVTASQVVQMRQMRNAGDAYTSIAKRFDIHPVAVRNICLGRKWRHVGGPIALSKKNQMNTRKKLT